MYSNTSVITFEGKGLYIEWVNIKSKNKLVAIFQIGVKFKIPPPLLYTHIIFL
jgi:hypothetical protein